MHVFYKSGALQNVTKKSPTIVLESINEVRLATLMKKGCGTDVFL